MIQGNDFIKFLKFIDQYPTDTLTIDKLESRIVEYFESQMSQCDNIFLMDDLELLCEKYGLKCMYLFLHNKKMSLSESSL